MNINRSLIIKSALSVLIVSVIMVVGLFLDANLYGLLPGQFTGVENFFLFSIIHTSADHFQHNMILLLPLLFMLYFFCDKRFFLVLLLLILTNSLGVYLIGRNDNVHVGASGVVYAISSYLFVIAIMKASKTSILILFLTVLITYSIYSDLIPSNFDTVKISWESHLVGYFSGILLGILHKDLELSNYHKDLQ